MNAAVQQRDCQDAGFQYSLRRLFAFMAAICFSLAAVRFLLLAIIGLTGPVLPHHVVGRLREGMNKVEVQAVLGPPNEKDDSCWFYYRGLNPGWVEFHFDEGRLSYVNDESAYPQSYGQASIQPAEIVTESNSQ